ncbi:uncharacterized protein HMPREF1541_06988 [Cyphellophora europaea CBS 101466]|uniref:DUF1857-domain-containing protein n=1 Tax=Cyphellophora europaea (strain CBS 101466) TaxID=1220924 RepID=W2RR15_CYPE1|nr:uncharacterized protein HMPREF1541_06988 [Cyphellophora europaea CBS 101466]ETN38946.1 hypothetical protein HMPREF1541_06988 [Cyphellophora europaea CBS 101466]
MANYVAFTAAINPPNATTVITREQVWAGLEIKIESGETFVGAAIQSTDVLKKYSQEKTGLPVTEREVVFRDGGRRMHETCVAFEPMKVEFHQKDGGRVMNIISQGAGGETDLYMTYTFEWQHPELKGDAAGLAEKKKGEEAMAKKAVESTIEVLRELVQNGKIK